MKGALKFGAYNVIELTVNKIIDIQLVQVNEHAHTIIISIIVQLINNVNLKTTM